MKWNSKVPVKIRVSFVRSLSVDELVGRATRVRIVGDLCL